MIPPTYNGYGYDKAITNGGNYMALVGVPQNIFNSEILAPQNSEMNINNKYENTTRITEYELKKNITDSYYQHFRIIMKSMLNKDILAIKPTIRNIKEASGKGYL